MNSALTLAIFLVILIILGFNVFTYLKRTGYLALSTTEDVVKTVGGTAIGTIEGGVQGAVQGAVHSAQTELGIERSPDDVVQSARESIQLATYLPHRNELKKMSDSKRESEIGKDGYCLIGQDGMDGHPRRACVRVGINDRCLSNKIYPTMDICINPSLRT